MKYILIDNGKWTPTNDKPNRHEELIGSIDNWRQIFRKPRTAPRSLLFTVDEEGILKNLPLNEDFEHILQRLEEDGLVYTGHRRVYGDVLISFDEGKDLPDELLRKLEP